jgi:uncharacterized protein YijF (DUF1287 family)
LLFLSQQSLSGFLEGKVFEDDIVQAAIERTQHSVRYDGRYLSIPYPNGNMPAVYSGLIILDSLL